MAHQPRSGLFVSAPFFRYWRANAVSGVGNYVTLYALQLLVVLTLHGSVAEVGWLNAARWLPYLVFGLLVGALVDGRRRLPLMVRSDLVQALLLSVIPLLWWLDLLSLPVLLAVVVCYGTASVVNGAAAMSFMPRLVEPGQLQGAHARLDGTDAVAATAGPAVGGLLVSAVGAPVAVLVDAASYLYSAVTLHRLELDEPPHRTGITIGGVLRDVREGIRWCYGASGLATLALATHVWFAGNAIVGVVLAPYVLRDLQLSSIQYGIIGAAGGLGAVVGAAVTTWVGRRIGTGRTIIVSHLITTAGVVAMMLAVHGSPTGLVLMLLGQSLYGLAMGMSNSHEMSYRQLVTPDELQARTNTTLRSLNRAVAMTFAPVAGVLADAWGILPMLAAAAALFALAALWLGVTSFRNVRAPV